MDTKLPQLTPDFLLDLLSKQECGNEIVNVTNVEIKPCVEENQNFLSCVLRVKVHMILKNNEEKSLSLVVKTGSQERNKHGFDVRQDYFIVESNAYTFLKNMHNWFKKNGHEIEIYWADCIYSSIEQKPFVIILQDLAELQYTMCTKTRSLLDESHALIAIQYLAKIHGLSRIYIHKEKQALDCLQEPDLSLISDYFISGIKILTKAIPKYNSKWTYIADILVQWQESLGDRFLDVYRSVKNDFTVLSLGDCWTNNILFKYSKNKPESAKFIDFQFSYCNSFAWDLQLVLNLALPPLFRIEKLDSLLKLYEKSFAETVSQMGGDPSLAPSYDQIKSILDKLMLPSFLCSSISAVEINSATDKDYDNSSDLSEDHFRLNWFLKDAEKNGYIQNIAYFESKGLFKQ